MKSKIRSIINEYISGKSYYSQKYRLNEDNQGLIIKRDQDDRSWSRRGESQNIKGYIDLGPSLDSFYKPGLLTYFLDGSRRVFKVDELGFYITKNNLRIYPVIAGQIGVGCCKRIDGILKPEKFSNDCILALPDIAQQNSNDSSVFDGLRLKINENKLLKKFNIQFSNVLKYQTNKANKLNTSYENLGIALIQEEMLKKEQQVVKELAQGRKLNQNNYLVKDGSIEYRPDKEKRINKRELQIYENNYNWVLGVSKHFNPELCLDTYDRPNPGFIADLPLYHRTPVACYQNKNYFGETEFAVWYIRIRPIQRTISPFDGIIKVEKILTKRNGKIDVLDTDQVNLLSTCLIREKNPVVFGIDNRWANHLYPISVTERYIKSKFLNSNIFLNLF